MKLYSDKITVNDIYQTFFTACQAETGVGGYLEDVVQFQPRKRSAATGLPFKHAFQLYAGTVHKARARNGREGYALKWDDYGRWFALLFQIDPDAWISGWSGVEDFNRGTKNEFSVEARIGELERERGEELANVQAR